MCDAISTQHSALSIQPMKQFLQNDACVACILSNGNAFPIIPRMLRGLNAEC
jgi:hypothetical protein